MDLIAGHPEIAYFAIVLLVSIVGWFINRKVNEMEKDISTLIDDVNKIKGNYLNRFDSIRDKMDSQHEELIKEMTKLTVMVEKQSTYCELIQKMKEK